MTGAARWTSAKTAFDAWRDRLLDPTLEFRYCVGPGFEHVDVAPGRVLCLVGRPGGGKSALSMQWLLACLEAHPEAVALVCNVEMSVAQLLTRLLSHASQIPLTDIRERRATNLTPGFERLRAVADRLHFLEGPFDMDGVYGAANATGANVLCLDYIQRFGLGTDEHEGSRLSRLMAECRDLAMGGAAVVVLSAVSRQRDASGNAGYHGLGLASGRGSSELEFAVDSMHVMVDDDTGATLHCAKDRNNEPVSIALHPDLARMTFRAGGPLTPDALSAGAPRRAKRKGTTAFRDDASREAIAAAWEAVSHGA